MVNHLSQLSSGLSSLESPIIGEQLQRLSSRDLSLRGNVAFWRGNPEIAV